MQLPSRRKVAMARTAWRGLTAYGAVKHAQGRLSAKRSPRARTGLIAALAAGAGVGLLLGSRLGGGCGHDHDHDHGDLPLASAEEQAANGDRTGSATTT
jgi:hypothetical protein